MYIMFNMVDTAFSCWRALIVCYFLQESSKTKESSLHEIWNADTACLLGGADNAWPKTQYVMQNLPTQNVNQIQ